MTSLRGRLMALLVALSAAGLLIVGAASYAALRDYLYDRVDRQAENAVDEAERRLLAGGDRPPPGFGGFPGPGGPDDGPGGPPESGGLPEGSFAVLRDASGATVKEITFEFGYDKGFPTPELPANLDDKPSDAEGYRVIAESRPDGTTIVGAVPLDETRDTLGRLLLIELIVAAAVLAALAAAAWWLVRLGLAPLERMQAAAGAIAAGDLSRRVEPATERTEVGRLGLALNAMLGQIERAFAERTASEERLRRFLSDASHELRTPLASIRGYAELYRIGAARDPADQEKAMSRIESEAARMGVLVEDLLTLARLDEERELLREEVDLAELARESVDAARAAAPDREITLDAGAAVVVDGDAGRLRQVVDNLVRNALTHTPAGTPVAVGVGVDGDRARLEVSDRGPGLPPGDPGALFERFWRSEGGRERGKAGAGLGLAIVAGIVHAHGGAVTAADRPGGGAGFSVSLPAASAGSS